MLHSIDVATNLGISLSLLLIPFAVILAIVFGIIALTEKDQTLKNKNKRRMGWSLAIPFIFIIFLLIIYGLVHTATTAVTG